MSARIPARLAWLVWALIVVSLALGAFLQFVNAPSELGNLSVLVVLVGLSFATVGALIVSRHPENLIGQTFCAVTGLLALGFLCAQYAQHALVVVPGSLPGGVALAWAGSWVNTLAIGLLAYVILLFPTGRLPSRRWRLVAWLYADWLALATLATALKPGPFDTVPAINNPISLGSLAGAFATLVVSVADLVNFVFIAVFVAAIFLRFRGATGEERRQIKWFAYANALLIIWWGVYLLLQWNGALAWLQRMGVPLIDLAVNTLWGLAFASLPIAVGVAILKYRLYDIDLLINRTLVYGSLTAIVVGLYMLVVGGLGVAFQVSGNPLLTIVSIGLIALFFHTLRERLQHGINHLLYGQRDEPYVVISRLGQRLEATLAPDAILPAIVEMVAQALKLPYVAVALREPGMGAARPVASYGVAREGALRLPLSYQQERLGEFILAPRAPGEGFGPADQRLLADLARQIGVAAHAARLTEDLQRANTDLQASRERLVTTREEERKRLRRDLHDGLGPTLAALALKARAVEEHVETEPERARTLAAELKDDIRMTVADIRRLVYALRPPALDELGLVGALREFALQVSRQSPPDAELRIEIEAPYEIPALPAAIEVAAYRIAQQALTNTLRHAHAHHSVVRLMVCGEPAAVLSVEIVDDGVGLPEAPRPGVGLRSMQERAAEVGGACVVERIAPAGTQVLAKLPIAPALIAARQAEES